MTLTLDRRRFLGGLAAASLAASGAARASEFPQRPVTMILPYAPGGSADVLGRVLAYEMQLDLGQNVIIDFKPGAGGNIGAEWVARQAPADGYSVLFAASSLASSVSLNKLNFDPRKDLRPVAGLAAIPSLMVVSADSPFRSVADVLKAAREKPGAVTYGSSGLGTGSHLAGELFAAQAGVTLTHVPYRGSGPAQIASGSTSTAQRSTPLWRRLQRLQLRQPLRQQPLQRRCASPTRPASACARRRPRATPAAAPADRGARPGSCASGAASAPASRRKAAAASALRASARSSARLAEAAADRRARRSCSWLRAKASKSCARSAAYSACRGCQVWIHISLRAACAASRPARPAACISSANSRSAARKSLANSAASGLTAATSVTPRKSWPLAIICVPTSTSTSPACTAVQLRLQRALGAGAVGIDARHARAGQQQRRSALPAARCRGRWARCPGCRIPGRRAAHARLKPQWWQRSVRSALWNTRQALQCGQPLFQPQAPQNSTGA